MAVGLASACVQPFGFCSDQLVTIRYFMYELCRLGSCSGCVRTLRRCLPEPSSYRRQNDHRSIYAQHRSPKRTQREHACGLSRLLPCSAPIFSIFFTSADDLPCIRLSSDVALVQVAFGSFDVLIRHVTMVVVCPTKHLVCGEGGSRLLSLH